LSRVFCLCVDFFVCKMERPAVTRKELRERIIGLHIAGHSSRDIANILATTRRTVRLWTKRYEIEGKAVSRRGRYFEELLQYTAMPQCGGLFHYVTIRIVEERVAKQTKKEI